VSKHNIAVVAVLLLAVGACQSGINSAASSETVPIRAVYHDSQCLNESAQITPIRDAIELAAWWQPLAKQQFPAKPLPQSLATINFDQSTAFVLFMGSRPTAGYDIELLDDRAIVREASLTIPASWQEPSSDTMVAQIMTSPCVVITLPDARYETVTVRNRQGKTLLTAKL